MAHMPGEGIGRFRQPSAGHADPTPPPPGWFDADHLPPVPPKVIPTVRIMGAGRYVPVSKVDVGVLDGLRHFFAAGAFPAASTDFTGTTETDYGHQFIRDAAYGIELLSGTRWPAEIGRPDMMWQFLCEAYAVQGSADVPNALVRGANDGEKVGRIPHEIWPTWRDSPNARNLHEEFGWTWPVYYGAVDTAPLLGMMTAREAAAAPHRLLDQVAVSEFRPDARTRDVGEAYFALIGHLLTECRRTETNPEGVYETLPMSTGSWGDWDDSYDIIRTGDGRPAQGRVAHTQVQAYVRGSLLGLIDLHRLVADPDLLRERIAAGLALEAQRGIRPAIESGPALDREAERLATEVSRRLVRWAGLPIETYLAVATEVADRLGTLLMTEPFLLRDHPVHGTYFVLGTDRDPVTNALRPLDVCTAKPALMSLVTPAHLPPGAVEIALRQAMDPRQGLLVGNGVLNLSVHDEFFADEIYHHCLWPHQCGLLQLGAERQGLPAIEHEIAERNWLNFIDGFIHGYHELLRGNDGGRPLPVQRDVPAEIVDGGTTFLYDVIKHGMAGQFWALCAAARTQDRLLAAWSGELAHRAVDPVAAKFEQELMDLVERYGGGIRSYALYHRDQPEFFDDPATAEDLMPPPRGAVVLSGQRLPGQKSVGRYGEATPTA